MSSESVIIHKEIKQHLAYTTDSRFNTTTNVHLFCSPNIIVISTKRHVVSLARLNEGSTACQRARRQGQSESREGRAARSEVKTGTKLSVRL